MSKADCLQEGCLGLNDEETDASFGLFDLKRQEVMTREKNLILLCTDFLFPSLLTIPL